MKAPPRWAALVTAIGALLIGLPAGAGADTSSPTGTTTSTTTSTPAGTPTNTPAGTTTGTPAGLTIPAVGICGVSSTGTTPPSSQTTPATGDSSSTTAGSPTTTTATVSTPAGPCIDAQGNVYIFYIITVTTTTTNTAITAPILAANGSITWVTNTPVSARAPGAGGAGASAGTAQPVSKSSGGWSPCTAVSKSTAVKAYQVTCPALHVTARSKSGARGLKLLCKPAPKTTKHTQKPTTKQKRHVATKRHATARKLAQRKRSVTYRVYCKAV